MQEQQHSESLQQEIMRLQLELNGLQQFGVGNSNNGKNEFIETIMLKLMDMF